MASPAKAYVVPSGSYLYAGLTGEDPYGDGGWQNAANIFNTGDERGPFGSVSDAWNARRLGLGTLDAPDQLQAGLGNSTDRFFGGNGQGSWDQRWQQWFGTDVTGPDGQVLLSPQHQTGLRVGQDYGTTRRDDGSVTDPWNSDMFQAALGVRNNLNQDQWLDPMTAMGGMRGLNASSPYAMPQAGDYLSTMQSATGGPGGADFYGQRGVDQTSALASANLRQLNRGIDTEAQNSLAMKLPEIGAAMQSAGLGRSGAAQQQMLQANNEILAQANRDKQRTMADYQDREANRQAAAINMGSQIGAQGYGQYSGQMGQAALAGLGDTFSANQANRQNEQALFSQMMQSRFGKNQGDQSALFQMLGQSGQYGLGELEQERLGQSSALADYMNLVGQREGWRSNSLNEMLGLADQNQSYSQQRLNQQLDAGMMPLDMMMRIATGTTAPSSSNYARTSPWTQAGMQALGGVASSAGQGIGDWMFGGGQQQAGYAQQYPAF